MRNEQTQAVRAAGQRGATPLTLAIDVGGTGLKAGILTTDDRMIAGPDRTDTPHPSAPAAVMDALATIVQPLGKFARISVGFPGVVRAGRVITAPNLGTDVWHGYHLTDELTQRFGAPARLANDATVQGLGVIKGHDLECVITLGTGMGFALFEDGRPAPHLELSQHPVHGTKTYDHYIGNAALHAIGRKRWNRRVKRAIGFIATLTNYDTLYIGGGNAKNVQFDLPRNVHIVSNEAGITGGIRLWDKKLDGMFG